jgi:periplasmic protein TonB
MYKKGIPSLLVLMSFMILSNKLLAQVDTAKKVVILEGIKETTDDDQEAPFIFQKVEFEATFPGGDAGWRKYLERSLNAAVPVENGAPAGTYTVVVQFVVDRAGEISDVRALTRHGYGMEAEVMRVIQKGPKWSPAMQNGRPVKAYRKQPVTFSVIEEKRKRRK